MTPSELLVLIKSLPLEEQQRLADEILRSIAEEQTRQADHADRSEDLHSGSLISPEDEKNVQRIWKTFGSC